jgi:septum formation protein
VTPIVLASGSPRRRALLEALGVEVRLNVPGISEIEDGTPRDVALTNAIRKRDEAAAGEIPPGIVIAADTVVAMGGDLYGKPQTLDEARAMLRRLSGRTHEVMTGVAIIDIASGQKAEGVETTRVTFRALTDLEILTFVAAVQPLDRAGAYTVDGPGSLLVERYEGCYTNVLGLPMILLDRLMRELGDSLFARVDVGRARFL